MKKIKKVILSVLVCACLIFTGCGDTFADFSNHTAEFYVLNATGQDFNVAFTSDSKVNVFESIETYVIPLTEEDISLLECTYKDLSENHTNEMFGVNQSFVPGFFYKDANGNFGFEKIIPGINKVTYYRSNGEEISYEEFNELSKKIFDDSLSENEKNEISEEITKILMSMEAKPVLIANSFYFKLNYNENPTFIMTIITSKLKSAVDRNDYDSIFENADENLKTTLSKIYFVDKVNPNSPAEIIFSKTSTPKEIIDMVKLLEDHPDLCDGEDKLYVF